MKYVTEGYEPQDVLQYFEDLSRIPRGSFNCAAVAQYVYDWGKNLGLDAYKDEYNNVVLKKPGSAGCENLPPVMLQGHLDIVAVKLPESDHDFMKDPLPLYVKDGMLRSNGTTLGADNGNACAYMMGVLARKDLVHPPLECVFTADEEVGLIGAEKLDKAAFTAKRMINMDAGGEDQTVTCVSCAGGIELVMTQKPIWQEAKGNFVKVFIHGLKGGHSAGAINSGRGNAGKLMARLINSVSLKTKTVVAGLYGGQKMNAIMSEIEAVLSVEDLDVALKVIEKVAADIKDELRATDAGFVCDFGPCDAPEKMLDDKQSKALVAFVLAMPNGVRDMSFEIEGHVLNSNNLGAVWVTDDEIRVWTFNRSGDDSRQDAMAEEIISLAEVFDYDVKQGAKFFGWKFNPESKMRELHTKLMKEVFDIDLKMEATHGGLETGVFFGKEPEMDIICFGPKGSGAHTPEEYLDLESFNEMFNYLCRFLAELTKE
ncbi:MAG: beta-Ala-His dipeptidase [Oscillospiraceae bacterium]|nr:beta-Ala-His dipeptidase [Oscillospiraceae bacterium]